jgi:hypothetical protein
MVKSIVMLLALSACSSNLNGMLSFTTNTELAGGQLRDGGVVADLDITLASIDQGPIDCAGESSPALTGRVLVVRLVASGEGAALVVPGSYPVSNPDDAGNVAFLYLFTADDAGQNQIGNGVSGSVTLTQITPLTTGTFSATMVLTDGGSGGDLSGSFNATFCGS